MYLACLVKILTISGLQVTLMLCLGTIKSWNSMSTLLFSGLLFWLTLWLVMGIPAGPGGQLFTLAILTLAAHLGGWALQKTTTLPALIGMLIMGVIMKNVGFVHFDKDYQHVVSHIRYCSFLWFIYNFEILSNQIVSQVKYLVVWYSWHNSWLVVEILYAFIPIFLNFLLKWLLKMYIFLFHLGIPKWRDLMILTF